MGRNFRVALTLCLGVLLLILSNWERKAEAAPTSFVFTAAGDHSANSRTTAGLDLLANSGASFYLALGDMSYSQLIPEV